MAVHPGLTHQYGSLEHLMRTRYIEEFPNKDPSEFDRCLSFDRVKADSNGRKTRYTFDERRFLSDSLTWHRFWSSDTFPGIKPPSRVEMEGIDTEQKYQQFGFKTYRGDRGGLGRGRGYGGRGMISPSRGRGSGGGGRGSPRGGHRGRGQHAFQHRQQPLGMFDRGENLSSLDLDSELLNLQEETTTISHDLLSINTADTTDTLSSENAQVHDLNIKSIVCRQCGVTGHTEMGCPYEIVMKQALDRERHLICGTPGHKAFRFNAYYGCLECKKARDEVASGVTIIVEGTKAGSTGAEGANERVVTKEPNVENINKPIEPTGATGAPAACGWEERNSVKTIAISFVAHKLQDRANIWEEDDTEIGGGEADGVASQTLIKF